MSTVPPEADHREGRPVEARGVPTRRTPARSVAEGAPERPHEQDERREDAPVSGVGDERQGQPVGDQEKPVAAQSADTGANNQTRRSERTGARDEPFMTLDSGPKKAAHVMRAALNLGNYFPNVDYGEYVIVRTPATLAIVIVCPGRSPRDTLSFATELSALT